MSASPSALEIAARTQERVGPSRIERILFVAIILVSEGLTHIAGAQDSASGSILAEAIWGLAYLGALIGIYVQRETAMPLIRRSAPVLLIAGLALLSTVWSYDHAITLRRAFGLFGTTAIAYYVVTRYSLRDFLETLAWTFKALALGSILMVIFVPSLGVMQDRYQGAWQGLTLDKNRLGGVMSLGVATMLLLMYALPEYRKFREWCWVTLMAVCLGGSVSATAILALFFVVAFVYAMFRLRHKRITFAAGLLCAALAAVAGMAAVIGFGPGDVLALFGRDATLTGRTDIWQYALSYIQQRPLLGWGYEVFWDDQGPVKPYLMKDLGWEPASAHDGFLEVAINFGIVGVAVFAIFLFESARRSLRFFQSTEDRLAAWPLSAVILLTITNLADPTFVYYNELRWLAMMAAFLYATGVPVVDTKALRQGVTLVFGLRSRAS